MTVTYAYHPDRSLKSVTDWEGRVTLFAYYQDGSLFSINRPNGTRRVFAYTAAGELESLAETRPGDEGSGAGALMYYTKFGYNGRGHLEQRHVFPADPAAATRSPAMTAVANADNQLATVNGAAQTYDLRGNTQTGRKPDGSGAAAYQFDARNRLVSLSGGGSYGYDLSDTRVRVAEGSQVTEFGVAPLGGMSQVLVEKRPGGVVKTYVYTPNGKLLYEVETSTVSAASTVTDEETGETFVVAGGSPARYFHYDMTGSTVAITDEQANVLGRVYYTPYGEITARSGSTDTRFLFCGAYGVQTDASGLVHMRARYYNPHLCRFINEDPIGFEGGVNWCGYAGGNPIMRHDPNGMRWDEAAANRDDTNVVVPRGYFSQLQDAATFYKGSTSFRNQSLRSALTHGPKWWNGPKCNLFVAEAIIRTTTLPVPLIVVPNSGNVRYPTAVEWQAPNVVIPGFSMPHRNPSVGDVVTDGTHMGIRVYKGVMQASTRTESVYVDQQVRGYPVGRTPVYQHPFAGDSEPGYYSRGIDPEFFNLRYENGRGPENGRRPKPN